MNAPEAPPSRTALSRQQLINVALIALSTATLLHTPLSPVGHGCSRLLPFGPQRWRHGGVQRPLSFVFAARFGPTKLCRSGPVCARVLLFVVLSLPLVG